MRTFLQYADKLDHQDIRVMPLWDLDELLAANQCIDSFAHRVRDVKSRFKKWGGVIRFVLEQTSDAAQEKLEEAIVTCGASQLSAALLNIESVGGSEDGKLTHKLVHMTASSDYKRGPQRFASAYVKDRLVQKLLQYKQRNKRQQLAALGTKDLASFEGRLWEDDTLELLPKGLTCYLRDLQNPAQPPAPFQLPAAADIFRVGNDFAGLDQQGSETIIFGKQTNLPCGDALRQNDSVYQITVSQQHALKAVGLAQIKRVLKAKPVFYWIVHPSIFLDFERVSSLAGSRKNEEFFGDGEINELKTMQQFALTYDWKPAD